MADHFLHVSGVVTTLFTAILIVTKHKEISRGVRKLFHKFWDYLGFITNRVLFMIGVPLLAVETAESIGYPPDHYCSSSFDIMMLSRALWFTAEVRF